MIQIFLKGKIKRFSLFIGLIFIVTTSTAYTQIDNNKNSQVKSAIKPPIYTSEGVIELVKKQISEGGEDELFKKYYVEKSLNSELLSKMLISSECRGYLDRVIKEDEGKGISTIDLLDIDNDNEDELVVYEYAGGTGGYTYISVMKKDESGVYKFSEYPNYGDVFSRTWLTHAYIRVEGKNYYIDKEFNFFTHVFEGINIYSFNKGQIVEHTFVAKYSDKFNLSTEFILEKRYNELRDRLFSEADKVFTDLRNGDIYYGKVEKVVPEKISRQWVEKWNEVDINNDLKPELIGKGSSFLGATRFFYLIVLNKSGNNLKEIDLHKNYNIELYSKSFSAQGFWTEKYLGKTYVTLLIQDIDQNVYHFQVFLLEKSRAKKVIDIKAEYIKQASSKTWTEGVNIKFKHATKYLN